MWCLRYFNWEVGDMLIVFSSVHFILKNCVLEAASEHSRFTRHFVLPLLVFCFSSGQSTHDTTEGSWSPNCAKKWLSSAFIVFLPYSVASSDFIQNNSERIYSESLSSVLCISLCDTGPLSHIQLTHFCFCSSNGKHCWGCVSLLSFCFILCCNNFNMSLLFTHMSDDVWLHRLSCTLIYQIGSGMI